MVSIDFHWKNRWLISNSILIWLIFNEKQIDEDLKSKLPYREWLKEKTVYIESSLDKYEGPGLKKISSNDLSISSKLFLLHKEERSSVIKPLAIESNEGTGSMGDDTALAVMSKMHRQIYDYFMIRANFVGRVFIFNTIYFYIALQY